MSEGNKPESYKNHHLHKANNDSNVSTSHSEGPSYKKYDDYNDDAYLDSFPKGYRFLPSDEELVSGYLEPKIKNEKLPPNRFHEVDLYKETLEELTKYRPQGDNTWYFFTPRKRKYPKGTRPSRQAGPGYWKATGKDKEVMRNGIKIGSRKALVYYLGHSPKGDKQPWIMHEYILLSCPSRPADGKDSKLNDCVLCKIYKNTKQGKAGEAHAEEVSANGHQLPQVENSPPNGFMELENANNNDHIQGNCHVIEEESVPFINTSSSDLNVCTSPQAETLGQASGFDAFSRTLGQLNYDDYDMDILNVPDNYIPMISSSSDMGPYPQGPQCEYWYGRYEGTASFEDQYQTTTRIQKYPSLDMENFVRECCVPSTSSSVRQDEEGNEAPQKSKEHEKQPSQEKRD